MKSRPTTAIPYKEQKGNEALSYNKVGQCLAQFQILTELGKGSYGVVYKVKSIVDNQIYVLKKINLTHLKPKQQNEALKEAQILRKLSHPNIIKYWVSFIESNDLCIVMEYAEGGDLQQYLRVSKEKHRYLSEETVWQMAKELALALKHIHDNNIIHRDIKTLNVFLTKDRKIKLGDLGVSKIFNSDIAVHGTRVGTPLYLSPELVQTQPYDFKVDIWAYGCVIYHLVTLEPPFSGENLINLGYNIVHKAPKPLPSQYSQKLNGLVVKLLEKQPKMRPSINEIIAQFFEQPRPQTTVELGNFEDDMPQLSRAVTRPQSSHITGKTQEDQTEKIIKRSKKLVVETMQKIEAPVVITQRNESKSQPKQELKQIPQPKDKEVATPEIIKSISQPLNQQKQITQPTQPVQIIQPQQPPLKEKTPPKQTQSQHEYLVIDDRPPSYQKQKPMKIQNSVIIRPLSAQARRSKISNTFEVRKEDKNPQEQKKHIQIDLNKSDGISEYLDRHDIRSEASGVTTQKVISHFKQKKKFTIFDLRSDLGQQPSNQHQRSLIENNPQQDNKKYPMTEISSPIFSEKIIDNKITQEKQPRIRSAMVFYPKHDPQRKSLCVVKRYTLKDLEE